jgi:hypothetical protein
MIDMEDTGTIDWFVVEFRGGDRSTVRWCCHPRHGRSTADPHLDALVPERAPTARSETLSTNDLDREHRGSSASSRRCQASSTPGDSQRSVRSPNPAGRIDDVTKPLVAAFHPRRLGRRARGQRRPVEAIVARLDELGFDHRPVRRGHHGTHRWHCPYWLTGTFTAVSNRVSRRQARRWGQQDQSAYPPQQYAPQQYPPQQYAPPPPAPPPPSAGTDLDLLTKVAQLHEQGVLTDEEFAKEKAKILGL